MKTLILLLTALTVSLTPIGNKKKKKAADDQEPAKIQVAILLDTSNSMDGLIDQAKSQLWKMVNELALAKDDNGNIPNIEIALYDYGNDNHPAKEGYIKLVTPLTADLDLISEKLFGLTTRGGNEFCGQVIATSVDQLAWSEDNDELKVIFIAGNEPFTQGKVDYKDACKTAINKGIIVNTIFCGNHDEGIDSKWKDGADLADGKYINIDQNVAVVHIDAPQDTEIEKLNQELNKTYIGYGGKGAARMQMQQKQDSNAATYGKANAVQRAISKSSANYKNADWDLVDAMEEGAVDLEEVEADELPEEMQEMDTKERKEYVEKQAAKRVEIQNQISELNIARREYVANERAKTATENTLDEAIINTIRSQAKSKNLKFEQ